MILTDAIPKKRSEIVLLTKQLTGNMDLPNIQSIFWFMNFACHYWQLGE